jgi:hypothetical protein
MVSQSLKIGQYISDQENTIMAKQMQQQEMNVKRRPYCNKRQDLTGKHIRESAASDK